MKGGVRRYYVLVAKELGLNVRFLYTSVSDRCILDLQNRNIKTKLIFVDAI